MKLHILKIIDRDDHLSDPMYFTIKDLRDQVLNEWYDIWSEQFTDTAQTKEEIETDDEKLFDFMNDKGFNIEFILTLTEKDIPKRSNVIEVDIAYYHPEGDEITKIYDIEGMTEEFENKLNQLI